MTEIDDLLRGLIEVRLAWPEGGVDLQRILAGAVVSMRGGYDLDPVGAMIPSEMASRLMLLDPTPGRSEEFAVALGRFEQRWRLPIAMAYVSAEKRGLEPRSLLAPTKTLDQDPTGHFIEVRFQPENRA